MKAKHNLLVLIGTLFCTFSIASSFRLQQVSGADTFINLQERLNISRNWEQKWRLNAVIPDYLQDLLKLSRSRNNLIERSDQNEEFRKFIEKLLSGVTGDNCKVHVTEWFARVNLTNLLNLMTEKDKWVLQMADAWGKIPEGILSGHVSSHGDFDECLGIKVKDLRILNDVYPENGISKNFEGQYCTSYLFDYITAMWLTPQPIDNSLVKMRAVPLQDNSIKESLSLLQFLRVMFGIEPSILPMVPSIANCLPNSCSQPDVQQILVNGLHITYSSLNISFEDQKGLPWPVTLTCTDSYKPPLDAGAIVVIVLLATLVTLALVAGVIDYWNDSSSKPNSGAPPAKPTGIAYKYLMAFSLYTNIRKWLSTRKSPDDMGCLHGIRFFSTCWVVLAHTYGAFLQAPQWNFVDINNIYKDWTQLAVINATFSVDTFFVMSGLLACYSILKMLDKTQGKFNIVMFYVHRYIRLTPTYAILVGISATLATYVGNGPQWFNIHLEEENCRKNWWTNILYVNNLVNSDKMCNGESWYLANDMQFYILSPLIVYPMWKWPRAGMILLAIYTALSCIARVLVVHFGNDVPAAMVLGVMAGLFGTGAVEIYNRPWARICTFLVGIWLGWLLYKTRGKRVRLPYPLVLLCWLCSAGTALAVLFGIFSWFGPASRIPSVGGYFYAGLGRFSWGVAIAWVIFACVKGYGGIVNKFLSWKAFMPLGRLCFCVYLTSTHIQTIFHSRLTLPIKWDKYTMINIYFAHLVMSYIVGFVCTLLFESPFITLQKLIFDGSARDGEKGKALDVEQHKKSVDKVVKE